MNFEFKNVLNSVVDVDDTSRRVKVAVSEMGSKDLDNDVIEEGAYTKTISERGPAGSNLIWHLTDHYPSLKYAVGKPKEIFTEGNKLLMVTDIPKTSWGNDVMEFYKSGTINQHSVGFSTVRKEIVDEGKDQYRIIKEIKLYEGSAVLWGANPNTPTMTVGKSGLSETRDELNKELNLLLKSFRDGRYTDDAFELIEIRIKQIQDRLNALVLKDTTPAATAPEPDELKGFADRLLLLTLTN